MILSEPFELCLKGNTYVLKKLNFERLDYLLNECCENGFVRFDKTKNLIWKSIKDIDKRNTSKSALIKIISEENITQFIEYCNVEFERYTELTKDVSKESSNDGKEHSDQIYYSLSHFYGCSLEDVNNLSITELFLSNKYMDFIRGDEYVQQIDQIYVGTSAGFGSKEAHEHLKHLQSKNSSSRNKYNKKEYDESFVNVFNWDMSNMRISKN